MPILPTGELTGRNVLAALPRRAPDSHKGSYGRLLIVAGSRRYRGAAALCAEGALRAGAGMVTLASVELVFGAVLPRLPEVIPLPCPAGPDGQISAAALATLLAEAAQNSVLCIGPGLGNTPAAASLTHGLAAAFEGPVLLDADALNALAGGPLPAPHGGLVITPHPGEMARLAGCSAAEVQAGRAGTALRFAQQNRCTVVLKGHDTVIAAPDGRLWRNTTGNPGLARGGSGDVLAGMIAALLAQGLPAAEAAACGVWLHGAAADRCAARLGQLGMLPHDILADLGAMFAENGL